MTVWFDFTTSLRNVTGRNGIAGVEWSVGQALLAAHPDVRAFALEGRRLLEIDAAIHLSRALYASDDTPPTPTATSRTWRDDVRAVLRRSLGRRSVPVIRAVSRLYQAPKQVVRSLRERQPVERGDDLSNVVTAGDVVVSIGADWEGGVTRRLAALRQATGCKVVTMVHDLIPLTHPHLAFANDPDLFMRYFDGLMAVSDLIVCNSVQSEQDLRRFAAQRGVAAPICEILRLGDVVDPDRVVPAGDRDDFYLWVGTVEARKNLELLYDALRILESDESPLPKVVVAGAIGWGVDDLMHELGLQATPAARSLVLLGPVDVATLEGLYARARGLLFPSYYEGWGLPVREAAMRGCPVAAGECAAVREALDGFDGATFMSPDDPAPWAEYMRSGPLSAGELASHPWSATAKQLLGYVQAL